jgi:hypothetical protein
MTNPKLTQGASALLKKTIIQVSPKLTPRVANALVAEGCETVADVLQCSAHELLRISNFGHGSLKILEDFLAKYQLELRDKSIPKPEAKASQPVPQPAPVWIYTSTDMPASGRQVLFRTWTGQIFYGGFLDGFGWFVPQPRNMSHDWDTLIKVNSGVAAWMKVPPLTGNPEAF